MRRVKYIFILVLLFLPTIVLASTNTYPRTKDDLRVPDKVRYEDYMYDSVIETPSVDASEKVYDFADLFTAEEEEEMVSSINSFIEKTSLDLAVVTINDNTKTSTMAYADDFYDYNDFKENGLVYVIDMKNREFYISTSGEAILYYDSYRIESMLSSLDNSMINGEYNDSVDILIDKLTSYYDAGYSILEDDYEIVDGKIVRKTPYFSFIVISCIVSGIVILVLCLKNRPVKPLKNSDMYINKEKTNITNSKDIFLNTRTERVYSPISDNDSSGGGSSSGTHTSSSGNSHGGGGHHF